MAPLDHSAPSLESEQLNAVVITERVNSVISILSIVFILSTYMFSSHFDKPINRLIFFASWGNLGSDIAALISDNGPQAGASSSLCRAQAFIVQMFLGVDALWAFCMAINVFLVFFRRYSVRQLRKLDIPYLLVCYGISFIPALVFLFIHTESRGNMYGPAIIWCWIDIKWDCFRIIFLYLWIWVGTVFALGVYLCAGVVIYRRRKHLNGFLNPWNEHPFKATITTEIHVTSETNQNYDKDAEAQICATASHNPFEDQGNAQFENQAHVDAASFLKNHTTIPNLMRVRSLTREAAEDSINPEAWLYARVAFLFFIALLITWIPSSVNRVYALQYPEAENFGMNYASAFVFPLQGFWNVVVYIVTSQTACRRLWFDVSRCFCRTPEQPMSSRKLSSSQASSRIMKRSSEDGISLNEAKSKDYACVPEPKRTYFV